MMNYEGDACHITIRHQLFLMRESNGHHILEGSREMCLVAKDQDFNCNIENAEGMTRFLIPSICC